jgi:hypothetical protein
MKNHTKIYMKFFGYQIPEDARCEICRAPCQDIHHIHGRGKGMDVIENLAGLCRNHHDDCHNEVINKSTMQAIHDKFMENNF